MDEITVVGGGIGGLVAAIECADAGAPVRLLERNRALGGRARTLDGCYRANLGPHVLYADGATHAWLAAHDLLPPARRGPVTGLRMRHGGRSLRVPPAAFRRVLRLRGRAAPVDTDFRSWATAAAGDEAAYALSAAAAVFAFDHDPGRLSAAFVAERGARVLGLPPAPRYVRGGWQGIVDALERGARERGVKIELEADVSELPSGPAVVAVEPADARALLGENLPVQATRCLALDVALRARRGDPFAVSDLDAPGWIERFSAADPTLAPDGEQLLQCQTGLRPGEDAASAVARLEALLDTTVCGWRERETWRRRMIMDGRTGAVDLPGATWRDRPAIARGDGVHLAGDWVAAPGLLSEVAVASAVRAAQGAVADARRPALRAGG